MDYIFSQHNLSFLDDVIPEKDKKKKEDDKKKKKKLSADSDNDDVSNISPVNQYILKSATKAISFKTSLNAQRLDVDLFLIV
ncbi:hypothetical protein scyTo_0026641 [Scyliorhinus torazame]|uniref:Uncharacterized protein n=1 Tax=Scyliorhinus torazame TaxID=75743 RepID=A0A401QKW2_SCYTO|nr:hypothetical protein [Scyliorhinus torazame]